MGHSTGLSDSYYRPTENDLLQDFLKCVDALIVLIDKTILEEQVEDLKEKSKDNEYVVKAKLQEINACICAFSDVCKIIHLLF